MLCHNTKDQHNLLTLHSLCSSTNIGTTVETCSHVSFCSFLEVHILQAERHWTYFRTISKTGYQQGV